jgi:hypothetical protein
MGLPGAECLSDKTILTFSRGELPHFAGINTFLKAPITSSAHPAVPCELLIARQMRSGVAGISMWRMP